MKKYIEARIRELQQTVKEVEDALVLALREDDEYNTGLHEGAMSCLNKEIEFLESLLKVYFIE